MRIMRLKTPNPMSGTTRTLVCMLGAASALTLLSGCHTDMWVQPRVKPYESSDFFPDGQGMRPLPAHTVDRTHFWTDAGRYTGYEGNKMVTTLPVKLERQDILRGQERFNIYCSPCHGALGNGQGMIAQRGLALRRQPGNYHTERLRKMPIGHFYDVITNGYGIMYSYASRVEPDDRWRIAAYIRVLQRSQNAKPSDLPADLDPATHQRLFPGVDGLPASARPRLAPGVDGLPANARPHLAPGVDGLPANTQPLNNGTNANGQ